MIWREAKLLAAALSRGKFTAGNGPEATAAPEALLRAAHHPYPLSGAALSPGSPNSQRVVATGDIAT